ncbi:MAG: magnesium/cobalt transporter CorA [Planctomycetes bacterium]|nr:magnesium/cobalt transporter CorA [Planctomycetota bacterium]
MGSGNGARDPAAAWAGPPRPPPRKPRHHRKRRAPPGASPGTLVVDPEAPRPQLHVLAYGPDALDEARPATPAELGPLLRRRPVTWVDVAGLGDAAALEQVGTLFGLHRLALEDVINTHQRPKLERYEGHHFLVLNMPEARPDGGLGSEQLSLFLGKDYVLTFQERPGDCFGPVRQRLRDGQGRSRAAGPDWLAYALLDAVIDAYFPVAEAAGERLETLEDDVLAGRAPDLLPRIHLIRRDLLVMRRALWPLREVVAALQREEEGAFSGETRLYLRDVYDHVINLLDLLENLREIAGGLMELHLSATSNRLNEAMKVLTVISTIFIPLTFIVGVYGMNFDPDSSPLNMPELRWYWGYPFAVGVMAATTVALLAFFRRRGWIGPGSGTVAARREGESPR